MPPNSVMRMTSQMEADFWKKVEADTEALRRKILSKYEMLPETDLLRAWRAENKILAVMHEGQLVYPAFQFDEKASPLPSVAELLTILRRDTRMNDWDHLTWFVCNNGWLRGYTPVERMQSDIESVLMAATMHVQPNDY